MGETLRRLLQAVRFERDAFVWMDFEDRATGDALVLVAVTRVLILLGLGSRLLGLVTSISGLELILASMINAAIFWLGYSALVLAITKFLLGADGTYATILRITGFAYPTLLLVIFTVRVFPSNGVLALVLGALWFLAIVAHGVRYVSGLPLARAGLAAGGGLVGWIVVAAIFGRGYI